MSAKILIVEDLFIEANDLRIILEKAGYEVCGIVRSVEQARDILATTTPDIVLLDIYLKSELTGIDLAKQLSKDNIPFIYLSANSNPSTFDAAKATQPYGFLVKPFRKKDILVALDIAFYRYKHTIELLQKQSRWFRNLLESIIPEIADFDQKLLLLVKAFKTFLPFNYVVIDSGLYHDRVQSMYGFQRIGYDEFTNINGWKLLETLHLTVAELNDYRRNNAAHTQVQYLNNADFSDVCNQSTVDDRIRETHNVKSVLYLPVTTVSGNVLLSFYSLEPGSFNHEHRELLRPLQPLIAEVIAHICAERKAAAHQLKQDKHKQPAAPVQPHIKNIIGNSPKLLQVLDQVNQVANVNTSVIILGETGVGKENLVEAIHYLSTRRHKPLIKINCAGLPNSLIEAELFGYERGAFTGATEKRIGKFEQAQGGTIFLDEIGEMPLELQSKLLRVIQEKELERLGGSTTYKIDVRIIAATNRNLHKEVAAGNFRIDLYYRINVFPIHVPPLRERKEDIPLLCDYFLQQNANISGKPVKKISTEAMQKLTAYSWPGNIRELQHLIERHVLITSAPLITQIELPEEMQAGKEEQAMENKFQSIAEIDRAHIVATLKKCNGKISGKGGAAEILKLPPTTLASRMKKLGISWQYILD